MNIYSSVVDTRVKFINNECSESFITLIINGIIYNDTQIAGNF